MEQSAKIQSQIREIRYHKIQINRFKREELRKNARIRSQVDAVKQRNEKIKSLEAERKAVKYGHQKIESLEAERNELIEDKTRMKQAIIDLDTENQKLRIKNAQSDYQILELGRRIHQTGKINKECNNRQDEENKENKLMKQTLSCSIETYSHQEISDMCKAYAVYEIGLGETLCNQDIELFLELSNDKHLELLNKTNKRIPDCGGIIINSIPEENEVVKIFLNLYFPNKTKKLRFNWNSDLSSCLSFYINELEALGPKIEEEFEICNFEVSQHQMKKLLTAYKNKRKFRFESCKLTLASAPEFGGALQGSTLEQLSLNWCGCNALGDWENNPSHFENLIKGLSMEQDFKNNLKVVWMNFGGMKKNQVKEILKKYQFGEIEIRGVKI